MVYLGSLVKRAAAGVPLERQIESESASRGFEQSFIIEQIVKDGTPAHRLRNISFMKTTHSALLDVLN